VWMGTTTLSVTDGCKNINCHNIKTLCTNPYVCPYSNYDIFQVLKKLFSLQKWPGVSNFEFIINSFDNILTKVYQIFTLNVWQTL
jgi:hypothetical protein